jgi:hypothetical protein
MILLYVYLYRAATSKINVGLHQNVLFHLKTKTTLDDKFILVVNNFYIKHTYFVETVIGQMIEPDEFLC